MTSFSKNFPQAAHFVCHEALEPYKSLCCNYKTQQKVKNFRHNCASNGTRNYYQCDKCEFTTSQQVFLKKHKSAKHSQIQKRLHFECDQCDFKSIWRVSFESHIFTKHTPSELQTWYECDLCDFKTASLKSLPRHKYNIHKVSQDKNISLAETNLRKQIKETTWRSFLEHENKNSSELQEWFDCDSCDFRTQIKSILEMHKESKHAAIEALKYFNCFKCNFRTVYRENLDNHILTKHPPDKLYTRVTLHKCESCDFKTMSEENMKKHKDSTHNLLNIQKCYQCVQCEFTTSSYDMLKLHKESKCVALYKVTSKHYRSLKKLIQHDHCYCLEILEEND